MAKQYDYDAMAEYYDYLDGSSINYTQISKNLHKIIKRYGNKILDVGCGTGNFTIEFHRLGYDIEGCDLSKKMLNIAKRKCNKIRFFHANITKPFKNEYDIIICMFNTVAHLTKKEFIKTLHNFHKSAKLIVLDIFNFDFMDKYFITNEFIDVCHQKNDMKFVRFNNNTLNRKKHIMNIMQLICIQKGHNLKKYHFNWQMQIYAFQELKKILKTCGFKIKYVFGRMGDNNFKKLTKNSPSIYVIAERSN